MPASADADATLVTGSVRHLPTRADVRRLLGPSRDFYAVADLAMARRIGGLLWVVGAVIFIAVLPLAPPTEGAGPIGWAIASLIAALCFGSAWAMLRRPQAFTPNRLLAVSYVGLAAVAVLVWLGGPMSPYGALYLLSVVYTAAVHPLRRVLPYLAVLVALAAAPLAYDGWNALLAATIATRLLIWLGLALVTGVFVSRVRLQRLGLRAEGDRARALARIDALTGLGNRRAFDETLAHATDDAHRTHAPLTLLVADLVDFKAINDRYGHVSGDDCLRATAEALRRSVRRPDACFRWGGDEFALVLPGVDEAGAAGVCARLRAAMSADCRTPDGHPLELTCGVAELEDGMDAEHLLAAADARLVAAKRHAAAVDAG